MKYCFNIGLVLLMSVAAQSTACAVPGYAMSGPGASDIAENCIGTHEETPAERVAFCTKAAESPPYFRDAWPYLGRAIGYRRLHKYDLALADINIAVQRVGKEDPNLPAIYRLRCALLEEGSGSLQQALSDCNTSLAAQPGNVTTLGDLAAVEFDLKDYAAALKNIEVYVEKYSNNASGLYIRGRAKIESGDAVGGAADITAATAIDLEIANKHIVR